MSRVHSLASTNHALERRSSGEDDAREIL